MATGNHTITEELSIVSGGTFNANGNTISIEKLLDVNGGTLNISGSTLQATTSSGDDFNFESASTLTAGDGAILSGYSASAKTDLTLQTLAATEWEIVGTLKNCNVSGDITVVGPVIDCSFATSSDNIRQWHHTLDTQQLLDADSGGDDDLKLERPALDNALELMTG